ncbi:ATP-binding protein [Qiania dongpingensis]|uniref:ATP-binding protein n=1 Tax=Qiania dongpingensis TaxID=2763669 RepID=A0A7G9G0K8_9FIRM|nr:ATP-binding protein [Qiania dongpingensis]QNM04340.1 ATP-binding protein [Qiania dongpingensis]
MALNNSQYDALMRVYQKKQLDSKRRQDERIDEVYRALPQMEEFDREISAISVEQARRLLDGEEGALERLRFKLKELRESKETLLAMGGFAPDYMEPVYTCSECRDTGYVGGRKCKCLKQAEIALLYGQSNLERVLQAENFDCLSFEYYDKTLIVNEEKGISQHEYMRAVVEECRNYAAGFHERGGNLLFTGPAGTGKTFLTNCIAKALLDRAEAVLYLTSSDLFQLISDKRFDHGGEEREEKYKGILECSLLIIDDLGTELTNSFTNSELFYCINTRQLRGRATIISTNLTMNELRDIYSERIFSRIISSYRVIPLFGADIRIKKRLSGKTS